MLLEILYRGFMKNDLLFYRIVMFFWATGEILWGVYMDYSFKDSEFLVDYPFRFFLAILGYLFCYLLGKERFKKYVSNYIDLLSSLFIYQMVTESFQYSSNWKVLVSFVVPLVGLVFFVFYRKNIVFRNFNYLFIFLLFS